MIDGEAGGASNVVRLSSWLRVRAEARIESASDTRTSVDIYEAAVG